MGVRCVFAAWIYQLLNVVHRCPNTIDAASVFKYVFVVIWFEVIVGFFYHRTVESYRRKQRAMLVFAISEGDSVRYTHNNWVWLRLVDSPRLDRFFSQADLDHDGTITHDELVEFIYNNGLELKHFESAFQALEAKDGGHPQRSWYQRQAGNTPNWL